MCRTGPPRDRGAIRKRHDQCTFGELHQPANRIFDLRGKVIEAAQVEQHHIIASGPQRLGPVPPASGRNDLGRAWKRSRKPGGHGLGGLRIAIDQQQTGRV